jgi:acyl dehydratase
MTTPTGVTGLSIGSNLVGRQAGPLSQAIDARWLMAYAAGLGESAPCYYDTLDPAGPAAHPIFPVCYEWPLAVRLRAATISEDIARRGMHAVHDIAIHRPPRAGDTLRTTARIAAVARRPAGALMMVRFETVDADGRPVTTTDYGSVYRGVAVAGADREPAPRVADVDAATSPGSDPDAAPGRHREVVTGPAANSEAGGTTSWSPQASVRVEVPVHLGHVYTECARIWNPIHTDAAIARQAGLPAIILHGSATLGLAVSRLLGHLGVEPRRVSRVSCRFTGMVRLPSTFTVHLSSLMASPSGIDRPRSPTTDARGPDLAPPATASSRLARFEAVADDGRAVLSRGILCL